ncbi:universal stress protein [Jatrophihabitans telluris]|uniref:Universal stress protein n=1 Tax=Jatrophihabitans telluris TaxID=2038343 RepID=A0ABY4QUF9_9ACTN|nr:universal stress protein [Jatrophihabitans telluris]UQX87326.1 universal stress protein [Jatrophihabitans telluris]
MTAARRPVIVVGVDGSDSSRNAVRWALQQAELTGAELRAVSSWRWPNYLTRVPPGIDLPGETAQTLHEVVVEAGADHSDVPITEHVIDGPAGPALLSQAQGAVLLVVGARGRAAFPGMLLGSVAEYCVRNGPCPVVVVRELGSD